MNSTTTDGLQVWSDDTLMEIVFDRPKALNSFTVEMVREITRAIEGVGRRAVLLRGEGPSFCAGGDLEAVVRMREQDDIDGYRDFLNVVRTMMEAIEASLRPVVVAAHGNTFGGGLELVLAADFVLLSDDTTLGDGHGDFGLVPGGGATQRLPRTVGRRAAKQIVLLGRRLSASDALGLGLADEVVPAAELIQQGRDLARKVGARGPAAFAESKQLLRVAESTPLQQGLDAEMEANANHLTTADAGEGLSAFREGRRPQFSDSDYNKTGAIKR